MLTVKKPKAPQLPSKPLKYYEVLEEVSFAWEQELDLNKLLKMIPKGIKRKKIIFKVIEAGKDDECVHYLKVFYKGKYLNPQYEKHLSEYKSQLPEYNTKIAIYKQKLDAYNYAVLKNDLKSHKKELKSLESQLKRMEKNV